MNLALFAMAVSVYANHVTLTGGKFMRQHKIAAIPGDGIGKEVIAAGLEVLAALARRDGGFSLAVELKVSVPGADKAKVQALMEEAHTICPYSRATKGNIPVKLTVV